jgi:hypothetical protein
MVTLHRQEFPDVSMDAEMMDAAAEMWIGWYRLAREDAPRMAAPFHRLQVRVWGFARTRAPALERWLIHQLPLCGVSDCTLERPDPDTLTVTTPWLDLARACPPSALCALFADEALAGLPLLLRSTVAEFRGQRRDTPVASRTLVLSGQWDVDRLIVKGVWPAGTLGTEDPIYELAPWPHEARFLEDLDFYRHTGELRRGWETEFMSRAVERAANRLARSIVILPGQPKLRVFLSQAALFLAMLATGLLLLGLVPFHETLLLPGVVVTGAGAWGLFSIIRGRIRAIVNRRAVMQRALRLLHAQPLHFIPVSIADSRAQDDPSTRKYSTELEALGCQHCADLDTEFQEEGRRVFRHYALPVVDFATLSAYRRKNGYFSWLDAVRQEFGTGDRERRAE